MTANSIAHYQSTFDVNSQQLFADTRRLEKLKATPNSKESKAQVAKEFTAIMLQMLVDVTRQAEEHFQSEWSKSAAYQQHRKLCDQQLAWHMANSPQFGLRQAIERAL